MSTCVVLENKLLYSLPHFVLPVSQEPIPVVPRIQPVHHAQLVLAKVQLLLQVLSFLTPARHPLTHYGAVQQWTFGYEKNDIYNITFTMNTYYLHDHYVELYSCSDARCSSSVKLRQYSSTFSQNPIVTVSQQYMKVSMHGMSYGIHDYWSASFTILSLSGWTTCLDCSAGTYQTGI